MDIQLEAKLKLAAVHWRAFRKSIESDPRLPSIAKRKFAITGLYNVIGLEVRDVRALMDAGHFAKPIGEGFPKFAGPALDAFFATVA